MPADRHTAFQELENGGFDAKQAETLVRVVNGETQATKADVQMLRDDFKADMKELRDDFIDRFATKAALLATKAELKAEIAGATNKMLVGALGMAGLLFAALKLFP